METIYSKFLNQSIFKDMVLEAATFKIMLLNPLYSFNSSDTFLDIRGFEIDTLGSSSYKKGGKQVTLETYGEDTSKIYVQGKKVTWPKLTTLSDFEYALVYKVEEDYRDNLPIYCMNLGFHRKFMRPEDLNLTWKDYLLDVTEGKGGECTSDIAHIGETIGYCKRFLL